MSNSGSSQTNFYSKNNVKLLYDSLRQAIKDSLHVELVGDEYLKQLTDIMQHTYKTQGSTASLNTLNKETLREAVPIFIQSVRFGKTKTDELAVRKPSPSHIPSSHISSPPQIPHYAVQPSPQPIATQNQRREIGDSQETGQMEHMYNQLIDQRKPNQQSGQSTPNFQEPIPANQPNVSQIYQLEDQRRRQSDLIPPPDPRTLSMLPPNVSNNVRPQPTTYDTPPQHPQNQQNQYSQQSPQYQTQQYNQQPPYQQPPYQQSQYPQQYQYQQHLPQYQQHSSQQSQQSQSQQSQQPQQQFSPSNINTPTVANPISNTAAFPLQHDFQSSVTLVSPTQTPQTPVFDNQVAEQNDSNRDINPPQPRQMRVLIPETSRNTIAKSDIIPQIFTLDSRDRDDNIYPDPAHYRIRIPEFRNVLSLELVAAEVPASGYVVNASNNLLLFQEQDNETLQAEIPVGNYSADDLATAIEMAMNALTGFSVVYVVTNNTLTNTYTINATNGPAPVFNLLFYGGTVPYSSSNEPNPLEVSVYEPRSIGPVIGFDKLDLSGATTYTGQFRYNLAGETNLYLHIEEADLIQSNQSHVQKSFAKIPLNIALGGVVFYQRGKDYPFIKHYSSDLGKLSHFTVSWRTHGGRLYDFNGQYHVLTFEIITKDITKPPY